MKAKIYVTLKRGVLDPQGKAIHASLPLLDLARRFRITMKELGVVGGEYVDIEGLARVGAAELRMAWSEGFAAALGLEG